MDDDVIVMAGFLEAPGQVDTMRWTIEKAAIRDQSGGLGQPSGIPITRDFAAGLITRSGAAIETVKRRRAEEEATAHA